MAEAGVTKKVLAYALKSLMASRPLSKITVGDICEACDMNRKSFYYHFRDKYDLVNWICANFSRSTGSFTATRCASRDRILFMNIWGRSSRRLFPTAWLHISPLILTGNFTRT